MDYTLDIIIPKEEIKNVKLKEKLIQWGGQVYSCDPPQYVTDSNIVFEQIRDISYFSKIIGKEVADDAIVLHLKSEMLSAMEYAANKGEAILEENVLFDFLGRLFQLSQFCILLVREDENIKERYQIVAQEEIKARLSDSLRWSDPKDVLLIKKQEAELASGGGTL